MRVIGAAAGGVILWELSKLHNVLKSVRPASVKLAPGLRRVGGVIKPMPALHEIFYLTPSLSCIT